MRKFFLLVISFLLFSSILYASDKVYYLQDTMQETEPGSGIYIIQGTDGRWYQMNGQDDSGEVIHEPLPTGNQVSDKILDVLYKLDEFTKGSSGSDTSLNVPTVTAPGGVNLDGRKYFYIKSGCCDYIQVYFLSDSASCEWRIDVNWGKEELVFHADGLEPYGYIIDGQFVQDRARSKGGCHYNGHLWHSVTAHSPVFDYWTNSIKFANQVSNSYASTGGLRPDLDTGDRSGSGYVPTPEVQQDEIASGDYNEYLVTTNYFNVKVQGPLDVNVINFDDLVKQLKDAGITGIDIDIGEIGITNNKEEMQFNNFEGDNYNNVYNDIVNKIPALDDTGEQVDDNGNSKVTILAFPFKLVKDFGKVLSSSVSSSGDDPDEQSVQPTAVLVFPSFEFNGYKFWDSSSVDFYKVLADLGMSHIHKLYFCITDLIFSLHLFNFARKKVSEFFDGRSNI